jgi:predicted PurR-regulated permease PerM
MNALLRQFLDPTRKLALATVALFAQGLLQLLLVIFFVFFIFRDADIYANALHTGSRKLAGELGERMLNLAEGTVTGVMVGIVGTAAAQSLVAMIGFIIAGVPGVIMLTFATFFFSMVPVIGATLIWLGAAAWLYNGGEAGWAIFMVLWGMFGISSVDNFVKPILISRTSSLPLLLIVVGVFGGVLVFGFIGLFLGPTLLALGQVLIREWLAHADNESSAA